MRVRAHQGLYGHTSSTHRQKIDMAQAVSAAHAKYKRDERAMEEEGVVLDRQLKEYERMLQMVDGGGFRQVVEDWGRVQREKEECMGDLRRLGWTGD